MTITVSAAKIPADTFANRLILSRAMAGHLSIREAAERCGLGRGAWQNWEKGARPDDYLGLVELIAERLEVDEQWLRDGGSLAPAEAQVRPPRWRQNRNKDVFQRAVTRPPGRAISSPMGGRPPNRPARHSLPSGQRRPAKVRP